MNIRTILLSLILFSSLILKGQISSGFYTNGLNLAYNPNNKLVTGFFENYSGLDENTGKPTFSCIFYISGIYSKNGFEIESYYPTDKVDDFIKGNVQIVNTNTIKIKLTEDHGGCWNVQNFKDDFVDFTLTQKTNWIEIKYINREKVYFYNDKNLETKRKAYVVRGDIVYIDKIEGEWIHCKYIGKTTTEGWIKKENI